MATDTVLTFAGNGTQGYTDGIGNMVQVHRPRGMTTDGTSVYWVEFNQHTMRQGIEATGSVSTNLGQDCGGAGGCTGGYADGMGTNALVDGPFGLAFHYASNSIFLLDAGNNVIRRVQ